MKFLFVSESGSKIVNSEEMKTIIEVGMIMNKDIRSCSIHTINDYYVDSEFIRTVFDVDAVFNHGLGIKYGDKVYLEPEAIFNDEVLFNEAGRQMPEEFVKLVKLARTYCDEDDEL